MPENGEINQTFGVYRNVCCGRHIIIRIGAKFPDCSNHPKLTTIWKELEVDVQDIIVLPKKAEA